MESPQGGGGRFDTKKLLRSSPGASNANLTSSPSFPTPSPAASPPPYLKPSSSYPPAASPSRLLSTKLPRGRHLIGASPVYDIDVRFPGEVQPQLEVTPITKYASDPGLVFGRQIAVNRSYICYGLKLGAIRVLNIITAMRSLLRGHTQRVTDMAFFAEDVHLLASASADGRVFVWRINEASGEEDKPPINWEVVLAIQIVGNWESIHPRLCWHPHKQEILVVGIGNTILKVDTIKVGKGRVLSAEEPINCHIDKLVNGVKLFGRHEDEVTELSMCQWMTTRLASASRDGVVKIWADHKADPLAVLRPHSGLPVNSIRFLIAPHRPDHIVLVTGGPLNRELKIWAFASGEGWLLHSDCELWHCTQTLELKSSAESKTDDAFFNQAVALTHAGLFLLANAKKNAIYAIHIDYGPSPSETRMDYIAEFTVTMPVLSLTGTCEALPSENTAHVYCVQTQAIQQYALDLSQCLPPPLEDQGLEKVDSSLPSVSVSNKTDNNSGGEYKSSQISIGHSSSVSPLLSSSSVSTQMISFPEARSSALPCHESTEDIQTSAPSLALSPRLTRKPSGVRGPSKSLEPLPYSDSNAEQSISRTEDLADAPSSDDKAPKIEKNVELNSSSMVKRLTHHGNPSELSASTSFQEDSQITPAREASSQNVAIINNTENTELEVNVVDEAANKEADGPVEPHVVVETENSFYSQASDLGMQVARDFYEESYSVKTKMIDDTTAIAETARPSGGGDEASQNLTGYVPANGGGSGAPTLIPPSTEATKGKRDNGKSSQGNASSPPLSRYNSANSSFEQGSGLVTPTNPSMSQLSSTQDMLYQLVAMQEDLKKQMNALVSGPINKEGERLEMSFGWSIEKVVKANVDALWARLQEENAKHEKSEREGTQQIMNLITNCLSKDLPALLERSLKKEIAAVGAAVVRAVSPILEKCISSAIVESFQKEIGEKAMTQFEKSVNAKLEATMAREIELQFQTYGKKGLQGALRSAFESSVIPAFEMACKAMFEQVDVTFQNGLLKHANAVQQHCETSHSPLATSLRDAIDSASRVTRTLSGELADGQHKLFAIAAARASSNSGNPLPGILPGLDDMGKTSVDPAKELSRLAAERKYEEAFTAALHRSDVSIVSWLCSQVDMQGILSLEPIPLSQGVLLALLQQLACDISNDTPRKVAWMTDVAVAVNPTDPTIAMHARPIFNQVYQILGHHRNLATTLASEASSIRLLMHVVNSVLSCK